MKNLLIFFVIVSISCKKKTTFTRYYENGTVESTYSKRNGLLHGLQISYYPNGKKHRTHNWIDGKAEGWSFEYDSVKSELIKKIFLKNNIKYTILGYKNNKCNYLYLRPYIPIETDTISYLRNSDSIPVIFYIDKDLPKIDEFIVNERLVINEKEENYLITVYPFNEKSYLKFDDKRWHISGFKLAIYIHINQLNKENEKYFDSVDYVKTKKIIKIL